jgi:2,3-bisphosphoglycerate-dependent phosphoglycerate mutase
MQLYFIRHGQSANNRLWDTTSSDEGRVEDPELTDAGQQQAKLVAQFLAQHQTDAPATNGFSGFNDFQLTHLYASPMVRTLDTAQPISEALDLPIFVWEEIHEQGGIWSQDETSGQPLGRAGRKRAEFASRFPACQLPDYFDDNGWWNRPVEDHETTLDRARRFVTQLKERHGDTDHSVAIVSHGAFYNYLLGVLLNIPINYPESSTWFVLHNTAITRFDFLETHMRIAYSNRVDFLPAHLIT